MKRLQFLDGLRGVAILLVICFHAFFKWQDVVPYRNAYSEFPVFKYGYLGVQLFFLISGFVILMSIEQKKHFFAFIYKRWLRLFPAMLIATVLVYFTSQFLHERPTGIPKPNSVLPGLIFTDPGWIKLITGIEIRPIEGAFWSLFVEFKFYVIFGLLYFWFGRMYAIAGIFLMYTLGIAGQYYNFGHFNSLFILFSFPYFGWFAGGSLAYLYFASRQKKYIVLSISVNALQVVQYYSDFKLLLFSMIIIIIFIVPVYFEKTRFLLTNSFLLFFGLISYPLYLVHENAMISLIIKLSKIIDIPYILQPIIPIGILVVVSYIIVKAAEPFVLKSIKKIAAAISFGFTAQ